MLSVHEAVANKRFLISSFNSGDQLSGDTRYKRLMKEFVGLVSNINPEAAFSRFMDMVKALFSWNSPEGRKYTYIVGG